MTIVPDVVGLSPVCAEAVLTPAPPRSAPGQKKLDVRIDETRLQGLEPMTVRDLYDQALIGEVRTQLDPQAGENQPWRGRYDVPTARGRRWA